MTEFSDLSGLGWKPFFQQQLTIEEWETATIARVSSRDRSVVHLLTTDGNRVLDMQVAMSDLASGDWVLLDESGAFGRRLERSTLFSRKAAGERAQRQLIAANIDTAFIVSSMNQDFNLNRVERYLALAGEAGSTAVLALTKQDLCEDPHHYITQAQQLDPALAIVGLNSLDPESAGQLLPWCGPGNTVVFLGSSGVGKSTLINSLFGESVQLTASIREDDAKGRHTTTGRTLHCLPGGGLLLDTPGMRELQLTACETGIEKTFADITGLASDCRFTDCRHENEPGCAVRAAVEAGQVDKRRLSNYHKLLKEQAFNEATLAERREKDRKLGRFYRSVLSDKPRYKR